MWDRWSKYQADKKAPSTLRRYRPSFDSLADFLKEKPIQEITADDIFAWAQHRASVDGIKPRVINRNDLAAVKSVFKWATTHQGGKILAANPALEISLDEVRETPSREKHFLESEVDAILRLALSAPPDGGNPSFYRAKRWCPWICAYSGARIQEVTGLRVEDLKLEQDHLVMHFKKTESNVAKKVPVHEHLLAQGFLNMVQEPGAGPIFFDPARHRATTVADPAEQRTQKLAKWLRRHLNLDPMVDPNHGWRHTFKVRALGAGIDERISDAIVGHSPSSVARMYEAPTIRMMADALRRFPRYEIKSD